MANFDAIDVTQGSVEAIDHQETKDISKKLACLNAIIVTVLSKQKMNTSI